MDTQTFDLLCARLGQALGRIGRGSCLVAGTGAALGIPLLLVLGQPLVALLLLGLALLALLGSLWVAEALTRQAATDDWAERRYGLANFWRRENIFYQKRAAEQRLATPVRTDSVWPATGIDDWPAGD